MKYLLLSCVLVGCSTEHYTNRVEECTERGISYFKEIGSYPNLKSNDKSAEQVSAERCNITTTAF